MVTAEESDDAFAAFEDFAYACGVSLVLSDVTRMRIAPPVLVAASSTTAGAAQFWEDTTVNRCLPVRLFPDRDAALMWLNE